MPREFRNGRPEAPRAEMDEAYRVLKRPYVQPGIVRQDLEHVVRGAGGSGLDPGGPRANPPGKG